MLAAKEGNIVRLLGPSDDGSLPDPPPATDASAVGRAQRSIWLHEQLHPGTSVWNIAAAFTVDGLLDRDALERSFQTIVARHATLRSRFVESAGMPVLGISGHAEFTVDYRDVRDDPAPEARADAIAAAEAQRPFDVAAGAPFRALVLRTAETSHVIVIVAHHIVADGWSLGIIGRELGELYAAYAAGRESPLAPLTHTYADFVALEAQREPSDEADLAWWCERLSDEAPTLRLSRAATTTDDAGGRSSFELDDAMRAAVEATARACDVTPFVLLLTAFTLLVHRLTGESDVLVSVPTVNRERHEFENIVGMFVNPVVVRTTVSAGMSAADLLARVRSSSDDAFARNVPFDLVVQAVRPKRHGTQPRIAQLSFAYHNLAMPKVRLGDAVVEPRPLALTSSRFDVSLEVWPVERGLRCDFEYASDLFDADGIARLMDQFRTVLAAIVDDIGIPVSRVPLLSDAERHRILVEFNATSGPYRSDACLHELVAEQAARTPDAPAVLDEHERLTYRDLDERSNRLAHHLRSLGVGPGVRVALCVDRSPAMIVAVLAILKTGGAYVPLDPAYPRDRLQFIVDDADAMILVSNGASGAAVPFEGRVVDIDGDAAQIAAQPKHALPNVARPENLAYIIYTSGSTGRPKGTMIRHSAVALVDWAQHAFDREDIARTLVASSLCFDFSAFEMFVPLCSGGALVLAENLLHLRPDAGRAPTMVSGVPSGLVQVARAGQIPPSVRTIVCGGEVLTNAAAQELYRSTNALRVVNGYGPTECTTLASAKFVDRGATGEPSIGRPMRHVQMYVLDRNLQPLPIGAIGELYIAGDGLALGYWNLPDLTADRFVPNPFGAPGSRMYRTGDHGCWRADGEIDFVGRIDHQVKVRGFRVELGEIEAAFLQHPRVREAVAIARRESAEDVRLVAYVAADRPIDVADLRATANAWLPPYAIPHDVVVLDGFPRTPSGKIDRSALPRVDRRRSTQRTIHNPLELAVAHVFSEVLRIDRIDTDESFFDAGGDSLLAVRAANRLGHVLGQRVSTLSLFQAPTAASLAALLDHDLRGADEHVSTLQAHGDGAPLFCFHDLFSRPVHYLSLMRHLEPAQPVYGVSTGPREAEVIARESFAELTKAYVAEIKRVQPQGPYRVCGYSLGGALAFDVARQLTERGDEALLILLDSYLVRRRHVAVAALADAGRAALARDGRGLLLAARKFNWARRIWFRSTLRNVGQLPGWVPQSSRALALALLRAEARHRFQPFTGPTVLFQCNTRAPVDAFMNHDGMNGWGGLLAGPVERVSFDGDHASLVREPLVRRAAAELQRVLSSPHGVPR